MSGVNDVVPRFNYARFPCGRINSVPGQQDVDARVLVTCRTRALFTVAAIDKTPAVWVIMAEHSAS